jgi:hypothetical protein
MSFKMAKKAKLSPKALEDLYDSGDNRVTQERSDFFLPQVVDFVKQKRWMNIRPEYQRRLVWNRKKKSLFIESLLMNIPVPPIFLYETDLKVLVQKPGVYHFEAPLQSSTGSRRRPHLPNLGCVHQAPGM